MPQDTRKRQKKLERQKAKQKLQKRARASRSTTDPTALLRRVVAWPIHECLTASTLREQGLASVVVTRKSPHGRIAFVGFLVDVYCLGVKNVKFNITSGAEYVNTSLVNTFGDHQIVKFSPACARNVVEGAVAYAKNLGFAPHEHYQRAKLIFGDIDADECDEEFEYGKDGKPYFISGPNESMERCDQIVTLLRDRCGPEGFHFIVGIK